MPSVARELNLHQRAGFESLRGSRDIILAPRLLLRALPFASEEVRVADSPRLGVLVTETYMVRENS